MDFHPPYPNLHLQRRDPDHYIKAPSDMARPAGRSPTTITLTSLKSKSDVRTVQLEFWTPQLVGRASKTKSKNLEVAEDNILFDCPVISRRHAEVELQRIHGRQHVVIRDTGSTHGTRVNGIPLEKDNDRTLHEGDVIQLGDKVTNGEDAHDGIVLLVGFDEPNESQESHTVKATQTRRGFTVPTYTDDEDSEYPSEDEVSDASQHEEPSSAKTTPEQRRAAPGTPEQPIDVDEFVPRKAQVISLVEDTEDGRVVSQLRAASPSQREASLHVDAPRCSSGEDLLEVVPETIDITAQPILSQSAGPSISGHMYSFIESDGEDPDYEDDEHLIHDDHRSMERSSIYDEESMGSASDASEEEDEDDGPETYSSKRPREPSPELGTPNDFARSTLRQPDPLDFDPTTYGRYYDRYSSQLSNTAESARSPGRQHHFDPIRSAQSYNDLYVTPEVHEASSSYQARPRTRPSRWDVPPAPSASYEPTRPLDEVHVYPEAYAFPELSYYPSSSVNFDSEGPYYRPFSPAYVPVLEPMYEPSPYTCGPQLHRSAPKLPGPDPPLDGPTVSGVGPVTTTQAREAQVAVKTTVPIADIVEPTASVDLNSTVETAAATPSKIVRIRLPSSSSSAGKKRKADEMLEELPRQQSLEVEVGGSIRDNASATVASEAPQDEDVETAQAVQEQTGTGNPPPAKRARIGGVAKIAGTAVAGLAAGSVATMAFLCSPLAERAIQWLA